MHRPLHRARLPEEGEGRARQPEGRAAVLGSDRLRDGERAAGAGAGDGHRGRRRSRREPRALRARVGGQAAGDGEDGSAEGVPALLRLVLHAHLRARAPGAHLRVGGRRRDDRAAAVRRAHGGGALRPRRGAGRRARAGRGRRDGVGRAHGRARQPLPAGGAVARRPRRLPVLRAAADLGRPRRSANPPGHRRHGAARAAGARLPDGSRPSPALPLAAELPGARRPDRGGRRVDADPAPAGRGLRAAAELHDRQVPGQRGQDDALPQEGEAGASRAARGQAAFQHRPRPGRGCWNARPDPKKRDANFALEVRSPVAEASGSAGRALQPLGFALCAPSASLRCIQATHPWPVKTASYDFPALYEERSTFVVP